MQFTLFTDLIKVLQEIFQGVQKVTTFTKEQRDQYYQVMQETYHLLDSTLNMVIIRLGDILLVDDEDEFKKEVKKLSNFGDWYAVERDLRLCQSLRRALRETESLKNKLEGKVSTKDWNNLLGLMHHVLASEDDVAYFISQQFREIAESTDEKTIAEIKVHLRAFRQVLLEERQALIRQEMAMYSVI